MTSGGAQAPVRPLPRRPRGWVWVVDQTIQLGPPRILVILGCLLDQVPFGERALQFADLQLVALVPMEQSTGAAVDRELDRAVERTGAPAQIVADQGSDLKKGITAFCAWEVRTAYVPDVAHYGANLLERSWSDQPRWRDFYSHLQSTSSQLRQTIDDFLSLQRRANVPDAKNCFPAQWTSWKAGFLQDGNTVCPSWTVVGSILDVWKALPARNFPNYAAGTWGPAHADELLQRDGRQWREIQ